MSSRWIPISFLLFLFSATSKIWILYTKCSLRNIEMSRILRGRPRICSDTRWIVHQLTSLVFIFLAELNFTYILHYYAMYGNAIRICKFKQRVCITLHPWKSFKIKLWRAAVEFCSSKVLLDSKDNSSVIKSIPD